MIEQEERLLRCAQSVVHTREPLLLFVSAGVWQARGEEAGKPCEEKVWARGEKTGRSLVRRSDVARRNETYYAERGEEKEEEGEKPRRKKKAGRRSGKRREEAPQKEESGAKEWEKKGRSPAKEMKWSRGEKHGRICTHLRVQICAGKCIRAEINCLLMNMCREFDLIFQM